MTRSAIPVYGVCSLDGLVGRRRGRVTVVTDARRREVYWARYDDGERIDGPGCQRGAALVAEALEPGERVIGAGASCTRRCSATALTRRAAVIPTRSSSSGER